MPDAHPSSQTLQIRETLLARGEIAARLFEWSLERHQAFNTAVMELEYRPLTERTRRSPSDFGIEEDLWFSPGPESDLSRDERTAFGRYEAAMAFDSWCWSDLEIDQGTALDMAAMYCNRDEFEATDPELVQVDPFAEVQQFVDHYDESFEVFLSSEHRNSIEDGRNGYADLLLEKISHPCVFRSYEDGVMTIADGWHRTAAALAAGDVSIAAVIVPLPGVSSDLEPGF